MAPLEWRRYDDSPRFDQALALFRDGRLAEAKRIARRILADEPRHAQALHLLGVASSQQGNHTEGLRFIDAALQIEAESAAIYNSRGNVLVALQRFDEALANFEKAIALNPQYAVALSNRGNVYQELGQFDEAILSYDKAIALAPDDAESFYNRGGSLQKLKRFEEALASYDQAIALRCDYADAFSNRGTVLQALGRHSEAVTSYDRAIAIKQNFPEALCNRGSALQELKRFDEAIASYNKAIALKPDFTECFNYRGMSFEKLGRLSEALASFETAIALKSDYAEAYGNRGIVLKELKRFDEALASYDKAIALKPEYPEAFNNRGIVLRELQCWDKAVASLETALALKPDLADAYYNMGSVLQDLGQLQQAQERYQQAIRLDPNLVTAYANLADLKKFAKDDPDLAAIEALAAKTDGLTKTERIELDFALGKAYDDLKDYKRSFTHLLAGNAAKRATISYDETATFALFDRIEAIFTPERIAQMSGHGNRSHLPIFILGMPRSGTTLIEQVIASHPLVYGAGEVRVFPDAVSSMRGSDGQTVPYPELVLTLDPEALQQIGSRYLAELSRLAPEAERVTDKRLSNYFFVGLIHLALPEAKIIHSVRNPLDTCISCFSKLFTDEVNHTYDLGELGRYYKRYERLMTHWHRVLPQQSILEVRYEDVIGDFEEQARHIIGYCGLPWDPRCLAFHRTNRPVRTASATQVRQPIYTTAVGRWRLYEEYLKPLLQGLAIEEPATD
jgi:tetratricopeptide (TPR) repeat protein